MNNETDNTKSKSIPLPPVFRKIKAALSPIARAILVFLSFSLLQNICEYNPLLIYDVIDAKDLFYLWFILFEYLFSFLNVYSWERLFLLCNKQKRELFFETPGPRMTDRLRFLFWDKSLYPELAAFAFLFLVTPGAFHFSLVYRALPLFEGSLLHWAVPYREWIGFLLFLLAAIWGKLTAVKYWIELQKDKKENEKITKKNYLIFHFLGILFLYPLFEGGLFRLISSSLISVVTVIIGAVFLVGRYVLLIIALVYVVLLIRSLIKRKRFASRFRKICKEKGIPVPKIRSLYSSVFRIHYGESFSITTEGKTYSCKLLKGSRKWVPMVFEADGVVGYVHRLRIRSYEMFSYTTHMDFGYPSEHKKIVILSPVPSNVFATQSGKTSIVDNGESAWDYTIYTASAFLNALERDTLNYVPKKYDSYHKW